MPPKPSLPGRLFLVLSTILIWPFFFSSSWSCSFACALVYSSQMWGPELGMLLQVGSDGCGIKGGHLLPHSRYLTFINAAKISISCVSSPLIHIFLDLLSFWLSVDLINNSLCPYAKYRNGICRKITFPLATKPTASFLELWPLYQMSTRLAICHTAAFLCVFKGLSLLSHPQPFP